MDWHLNIEIIVYELLTCIWRGLNLFCREFERISENLQCDDSEMDWLRKAVKPIYSSNVQGLLRTKIEAGDQRSWTSRQILV